MEKSDEKTVSAAIYSRKSRYTGKGESIDNQTELCREYLSAHFGAETAENAAVYEDEGFSGGNLNRPGFRKMMNEVKRRRYHVIIVYRLDRISRNVSDFSSLIEELSRLGVSFISIREQFDTGTPMGRAMMYIASVFSQLERETIAERIRDNMHELAKTGRWLGGNTPLGYVSESVANISVDGRARKAYKLKLVPEEAETVKTIFRVFLETGSLTMTEAELMARRHTTRNGKYFTRFAIKGILQNPVYMTADRDAYDYMVKSGCDLFSELCRFDGIHGLLAYNKTARADPATLVCLPSDRWIVSVGAHEGMIPGKTWISAQELLEANRDKRYRRPVKNEALLTGLIRCDCGSRMYPRITSRKGNGGEGTFGYSCMMKMRSRKQVCSRKNVSGNRLDAALAEQLKAIAEDKETFIRELEKSRSLLADEGKERKEDLERLRREKEDIEKKLAALADCLTEMESEESRRYIARRIGELTGKRQVVEADLRAREAEDEKRDMEDKDPEAACRLLLDFGTLWDRLGTEQKRRAVRRLVSGVLWDGETARIVLRGASACMEGEAAEAPICPEREIAGT